MCIRDRDTGVDAPQAGRVLQVDGFPAAHGHVGLVGVGAALPVHADDLAHLGLQVLAVGVLLLSLIHI